MKFEHEPPDHRSVRTTIHARQERSSTVYSDDRVTLDDQSLQIRTRRSQRTIPVSDIRSAEVFPLTATGGRFRLVGLDLRRPRTWFHWDPERHTKTAGIQLDIGRFFKIGVTPDDADQLLADLQGHPRFKQE
jgi:hypothetical protein